MSLKGTKGNVLLVQSGGCTPVMNMSLVGAFQELSSRDCFGETYGAICGFEGLLQGHLLNLNSQPEGVWNAIGVTPGAALGSSRRKLEEADALKALGILKRHGVRYLFAIGGNDSAVNLHLMAKAARDCHWDMSVVLIPKTIDNDLASTDHSPGYGSAARFVALATMGIGKDAEGMGREAPIAILEVMGRNSGWLAAAAALGKLEERDAPHLICHPEVPIEEDRVLARIEEAYRRWGYAVAVVAENAKSPDGPIGGDAALDYTDSFGHPYFEGPARYLADRVSRRLKVRARFEKPGTIQRSLATCVSRVDSEEARLVGQAAVKAALNGHTDCMVTLLRVPGEEYRCNTGLAPLSEVVGRERVMPPEYYDADAFSVTPEFVRYAKPLIGDDLPRFARFDVRCSSQ